MLINNTYEELIYLNESSNNTYQILYYFPVSFVISLSISMLRDYIQEKYKC